MTEIYIYDKKNITLSYYKFNQNDVSVACFKNITHQRGTIIPLNYYALGNSGGESIFYAENGI